MKRKGKKPFFVLEWMTLGLVIGARGEKGRDLWVEEEGAVHVHASDSPHFIGRFDFPPCVMVGIVERK